MFGSFSRAQTWLACCCRVVVKCIRIRINQVTVFDLSKQIKETQQHYAYVDNLPDKPTYVLARLCDAFASIIQFAIFGFLNSYNYSVMQFAMNLCWWNWAYISCVYIYEIRMRWLLYVQYFSWFERQCSHTDFWPLIKHM